MNKEDIFHLELKCEDPCRRKRLFEHDGFPDKDPCSLKRLFEHA